MLDAIVAAIIAVSTTGECRESDRYPDPVPGEITGFVTLGGSCVVPTHERLPAADACELARSFDSEIAPPPSSITGTSRRETITGCVEREQRSGESTGQLCERRARGAASGESAARKVGKVPVSMTI